MLRYPLCATLISDKYFDWRGVLRHYRDKNGEIRHGKLPDEHPANYYSEKHRKEVKKGHTVKFKKHGDEESTGRVVSSGKHGVRIHCKKGEKHDVLHHEIIEHIGGKEAFQDHKKIIDLTKAMIPNAQARNFLPALRASISMLRGLSSYEHTNKFNTYRYKLEALRNKIITGKSIASEDINNMNMLMERAGREVKRMNNKKSKFKFGF